MCDAHVSPPWMGFRRRGGFTLLELIVVVAIISVLSAIAVPAFSSFRDDLRLKAIAWEIVGMIKEGRQLALDDHDYAICFNTSDRIVSLVSSAGADGKWNTGDEPIVRSLRLADKGGGLSFGYGLYGPVPNNKKADDGVSFASSPGAKDNTLHCNTRLTGTGGTAYIISSSGAAIAIVANTEDFGCKLWRRSGGKWVQM